MKEFLKSKIGSKIELVTDDGYFFSCILRIVDDIGILFTDKDNASNFTIILWENLKSLSVKDLIDNEESNEENENSKSEKTSDEPTFDSSETSILHFLKEHRNTDIRFSTIYNNYMETVTLVDTDSLGIVITTKAYPDIFACFPWKDICRLRKAKKYEI